MVVLDEVVVDGLRCVDELHRAGLDLIENAHGASGVVAADIDEGIRLHLLELGDDSPAIRRIRLVAGAAEARIGRIREAAEIGLRYCREIDEVAGGHTPDAVPRAEHARARM